MQAHIDVHHHFEPTHRNVDGTTWSIAGAVAQLDANNVATAIGYCGPIFDSGKRGRSASRAVNEWAAQHGADHPGRFGLFASIPMLDPDGALAEIAYAFDVLGADGVGLAPHYEGAWLGDARFRPIFEELNRRAAVVYVHPSKPGCPAAATLDDPNQLVSAPWIEFPTDTARTILSLWVNGVTRQLPRIRFLFCHGGGVMPLLLGRIAGFSGWASVGAERLDALFPDGIYAEFAKLYFELAQAYAPETFALLRSIVPLSHLLYGSDYSYFAVAHSMERFGKLDLTERERELIGARNATALLPRWER